MINVREVLQNHSQSTTLQELEARGRSKVRVINASEVARLIEESVRQTIAKAQEGDGMRELVEKSKAEFIELKRQRDAEQAAREEGLRQLEAATQELNALRAETGKYAGASREMQQKCAELDGAAASERVRVEELRKLVDILQKERDVARESEREARAAAQAAHAQTPPDQSELLSSLAAQVARLTEKMNAPAAPAPAAAPPAEMQALEARLEKLSSGISDRLEKFGLSIGVSGAVQADHVQYDKIFNNNEKLESNVEHLDVKERKASGIGGALERIKKMKLGPDKQ
ncbi:MAG: hypothetical protein HY286_07955 [Planctomycetes bacterium]|nr:hypothetical protein [Planctomycetota bacterium]